MSAGAISLRKISKRSIGARSTFTTGPDADPYWTNTSLLLHGDGANNASNQIILDSSTNALAITRVGTPAQGSFTPFPVAANSGSSYSPAANAGSIYFNGATDSITIPTASGAFSFGTGDFTLECWVYSNTAPAVYAGIADTRSIAGLSSWNLGLFNSAGNKLDMVYGASRLTSTAVVPAGQWVHVAAVRASSVLSLYINGIKDVTTATVATAMNASGATAYIGAAIDPYYFNGYISNLRIVKGTALYTGNFTVPSAPLTPITNTQLLLPCNNAAIYDSTSKSNIAVVGSAATMVAVNKYGGSSLYLNGTTDYLSIPNSTGFNLSTGNFTIEFWVYASVVSGAYGIVGKWTAATSNGGPFAIYISAGTVTVQASTSASVWDVIASVSLGAITASTWTHVALVRNGSSFTGYLNGVGTALATNAVALLVNTDPVIVGVINSNAPSGFFNGYIDDLRITKGVARYTSNFAVPTTTFSDKF